jgi:transposase
MSQNKSPEKPYIGADVSKQTIDFFNSETGEYNTVPNQNASLKRFLKAIKDPSIIVFEATGGYERKLSTLLEDFPHLERLRVHPACVKSFARALGSKAKTDKIDSYMLAMAAKTMKDTFYDTTPPQNVQTIRDLFSYQKQLEATLHAEKCRYILFLLKSKLKKSKKRFLNWYRKTKNYLRSTSVCKRLWGLVQQLA